MAIAATGAGLRGAGLFLQGDSALSEFGVVLGVVIPVAVYLFGIYSLYALMFSKLDRLHIGLLTVTALMLAIAIVDGAIGWGLPIALLIVMLAVFVSVIGYETVGHRHQDEMIRALADRRLRPRRLRPARPSR